MISFCLNCCQDLCGNILFNSRCLDFISRHFPPTDWTSSYSKMSADSSGKISLALGGAKKLPRPAPTNGVKRSHAALHDNEEDENDHGKARSVSHFDKAAGGAIDEKRHVQERPPLVIAPQANRDWKEASQRNKRQRSHKLPNEEPQKNGSTQSSGAQTEEKPAYGLVVRKSEQHESSAQTNGHAEINELEQNQELPPEPNGDASLQHKTDDESAMDALLGKSTKQGLVLPAMSEEEAFERDYKDAPEMATLEDYARVPVEEFGAALLRGMGWKEGEGIGANRGKKVEKTKVPERRPALLGIGAKEEAAVAQELGTWGKAAKDRKGPVQVYNPVLLRDKKTGELFTEEELEKKKAQDEREKYEVEFEKEERRKEKERRRRGDSRDRDYKRKDRDSKRDQRDDRDRRKYDSDEEYYRRKEKDRQRRERDREDRDSDRGHSRRYDSDRDKHRDRRRDNRH